MLYSSSIYRNTHIYIYIYKGVSVHDLKEIIVNIDELKYSLITRVPDLVVSI